MSPKPDISGYINPFVPGGKKAAGQRLAMSPGAEVYTETKKGDVFATFLRHLRPGSMVEVEELHYLAPGGKAFGPVKRRRILADRIDAIIRRGATIRETYGGDGRLPTMMMRAYEQIATSGRARKRDAVGKPIVWPKPPATENDYKRIWFSRQYKNDPERVAAIAAEFGESPSAATLRRMLGSPHKPK